MMARKQKDDGNTLASQRSYEQAMLKSGQLLGRIDSYIDKYAEEDVFVTGMSIRIPQDVGEDVFITVRAQSPDGPVVAFHGASSFAEALLGLGNRLQNRSLRWKADQYAK